MRFDQPVQWVRSVSLADKCLYLFGGAIVLIVLAALSAPWLRMKALVDEAQLEVSRALAEPPAATPQLIPIEQAESGEDEFLAGAAAALRDGSRDFQRTEQLAGEQVYRYAAAVRDQDGELTALRVFSRASDGAATQLAVNTVYLLSAGLVVLGLAILVFYIVTHRLILAPVRALTATAERVQHGDLDIRSDIRTGDEFEQLAATFNEMLQTLQTAADELRKRNAALDLRLDELAEANRQLYEAMSLKSDFLASVSHELRTPLNSIVGFAELLLEIAKSDPDESSAVAKRKRYLSNIAQAAGTLLTLIEDLLTMAKLEAGRIELRVDRINLASACEALAALVHPLAERKGVAVQVEMRGDLPIVETDQGKLQQIVFNLLANAVKFTPAVARDGRPGEVVLRAERLPSFEDEPARVRISVIDNGPGIPQDRHQAIFEKFRRLELGPASEHQGTGLGLAISKELAGLIQGDLQLVSDVGRGSMFSLILPIRIETSRAREIELESKFKAALAGRGTITSAE